ncbi:aspartate carbamoyltransferase regulatory subunit [Candidatus Bathyarchaeota archaeon RBG_16_48_13]|nr:MAG: aspartate carbamoyltransferase regulatory subunit [Candidatus Bathyarchaeota archaeon RBG_16_48_13]
MSDSRKGGFWNMSYDSSREQLKIKKIHDGTVIDHITAGYALDVLKILGVTGKEGYTVSVLMNVPSKRLKRKDIVKIEGRELEPEEVDKIALIAAHATINIVRNFEVIEKKVVKLPSQIYGMVRCANPTCISNSREPIKSSFLVEDDEDLRLKCHYCGRIMEKGDVLKQF